MPLCPRLTPTAQGLSQPITDWARVTGTDQRLYLASEVTAPGVTTVLGLLKTGPKTLFCTHDRLMRELRGVTCVLDFYVHESCQRSGLGRQLFDRFLQCERQDPAMVAYDRPSPKLLGFLAKHHGLKSYNPQTNNFVLFDQFWTAPDEVAA